MSPRILLVGCGITSAITAKLLQSQFENICVTIWEKLNEPGGRFNTISGGKNNELFIDLGAQYITTTDENIKLYKEIYSTLFKNNILKALNHRIKGMKQSSNEKNNYVAPLGMKSVVDHFLGDNVEIFFGRKLLSLEKSCDKWSATTETRVEELFDIVVLTLPVPEILSLDGYMKSLFLSNTAIYEHLSSVKYSSRFALGLFFEDDITTDFDAEYIDNNPVLRFVATDSWRNNDKNKFQSAVVHTTIQFGEKHYDDDSSSVKQIILHHIKNTYQQWPEPSCIQVCHWKYSQVLQPYKSKPGAIILSEAPLLIASGDGFIGSTFDQCLFAAKTINEIISKKYS